MGRMADGIGTAKPRKVCRTGTTHGPSGGDGIRLPPCGLPLAFLRRGPPLPRRHRLRVCPQPATALPGLPLRRCEPLVVAVAGVVPGEALATIASATGFPSTFTAPRVRPQRSFFPASISTVLPKTIPDNARFAA